MRTPSAFLMSLSLRRTSPEAVAPLPVKTRFDHQFTAELDSLRPQGTNESKFTCAIGLVQLLDASLNTQKIALELFVNSPYREDTDRRALDEYLEDNTDILDTCNYLVEKIEVLYKFVDSMRVVARMVDTGANPDSMARKRVLDHLQSSCQAMERESKEMSKRGSCLRRMLKQKLAQETEFSEIICGSKAMALVVCKFLELGLSFDLKHQLPAILQSHPMSSSWMGLLQDLEKQVVKEASEKKKSTKKAGSSSMMAELQQTMAATRDLQKQIKGKREKEIKSCVERLKRSCRELEDGLEAIEGNVKDLYKNLINVRMALLGVVSQQ